MNIQAAARFTHNAQDAVDVRVAQAGVHGQLQRLFRRLCARTLGAEFFEQLQPGTNVNMRSLDVDTSPDRPLTQQCRIGRVHAVLVKDVLYVRRHSRSLNVPTIHQPATVLRSVFAATFIMLVEVGETSQTEQGLHV
jgi:DNA-binding LytR/AlgR family response regulator